MEVMLKQLANRRHCTYAKEIVLKQHAKLSRLEKPDNGKRTKETGTKNCKMSSATWKLEDWGPSDPMFFELKAALLAFEFGETIEFGDDEEELLEILV
jgi:hypothetical protein